MRLALFAGPFTPIINANTGPIWISPTATGRLLIQEYTFSGFASSSTPMETRVARSTTAGTTPPTTLTPTRMDQTLTTPGNVSLTSSGVWATGPAIAAGIALVGVAWNSYGGLYRWLAAPGEEIDLALTTNYVGILGNSGTGVSAYSAVFIEL